MPKKKDEPKTRFELLIEKLYDLHEHIAENRIEAVLFERRQKLAEAAAAAADNVGDRFDHLRKAERHKRDAARSRSLVAKFGELVSKLEQALAKCGPRGGAPA